MINATDLRVGNWVRFIRNDSIERIDALNAYGNILLKGNGIYNSEEDIDGIPLIEQVLVKCGFRKTLGIDATYYLDNIGWVNTGGIILRVQFRDEKNRRCTDWNGYDHIKYLHQLQNLYYILTNTELKYQP